VEELRREADGFTRLRWNTNTSGPAVG